MTYNYFMAIDGDQIGKKLEHFVIKEELIDLEQFSTQVNEIVAKMGSQAIDLGGHVYLEGGDSLLVGINQIDPFLKYLAAATEKIPVTFSIGIGQSSVSAYLALKYAKTLGIGLVVQAEGELNSPFFKTISNTLFLF
jgi:hypothetical protein